MYVTFEQYSETALDPTVDAARYAALAPYADLAIDHWTVDRVGRAHAAGETLPDCVVAVYVAAIEALPAILADSKGGDRVASFSNGVDTFTFENADAVSRLSDQLSWLVNMLPVEWISACVGGCHAH